MKKKELETLSLGDRMKYYESITESRISPNEHLIIRVDGHHFSKFTRGFNKPYDEILTKAMVETTKDLVERFDAYTGYCQSDEITLLLPSLKDVTVDNRKKKTHSIHKRIRDDWEHSFGGRVQKIVSLVSAFTTMKFNKHLENLIRTADYKASSNEECKFTASLYNKIGNAYFDCRVYGVPDEHEVFNSFMWRVRDAEKNSRSVFAQTYCNHKELQGKTGKEQVEYCLEKTGNDWDKINDMHKYGTFIKKELYDKTTIKSEYTKGDIIIPQEEVTVQRTRICTFSEKLTSYSDENVKLIMTKVI